MKINIEFEKGDFNPIHDIVYDLTGKSLTHEELKSIWDELPEDIKEDGIHWGIDDTVVRDNIYVYLKKKYE